MFWTTICDPAPLHSRSVKTKMTGFCTLTGSSDLFIQVFVSCMSINRIIRATLDSPLTHAASSSLIMSIMTSAWPALHFLRIFSSPGQLSRSTKVTSSTWPFCNAPFCEASGTIPTVLPEGGEQRRSIARHPHVQKKRTFSGS